VLRFEKRAPRFEGVATLSVPPAPKAQGADAGPTPWRITAKVKADPAAARLEQLEANYGFDETALKLTGLADIRFGASPTSRTPSRIRSGPRFSPIRRHMRSTMPRADSV